MKTKRRKITRLVLLFVISYFSLTYLNAQSSNDSLKTNRDKAIKYAYRNLNGIGIQLNYKKAYSIFNELAKQGDGEACNAMGMMNKLGLGVQQNDEKALFFFTQAIKNGYGKGAYNLGLMYKYGHGVKQDYQKAAELIDISQEMGFNKVDYAVGYSYYKGQGRKQDYQKAVEFFRQGAEKGDAACMFNLGYCYFKGHGIERDPKFGKYWIEKAANKGLTRAVDFIAKVDSKTFGQPKNKLKSSDEIDNFIPPMRKVIGSSANNEHELVGEWKGKLITYDWSGKEIEEESDLNIVFEIEGNSLTGFWIENETNPVKISAIHEKTEWIFDNMLLYEDKRPLQMRQGNLKLEKNEGVDYLVGNVSFYSETLKEYTQPNYIILKRSNVQTSTSKNRMDNGIIISPNPFNDILNIQFTLKEMDNVMVNIFDMSGKSVYEHARTEAYQQGENSLAINASSFCKGNYVLQIVGKNINYSTIIIK